MNYNYISGLVEKLISLKSQINLLPKGSLPDSAADTLDDAVRHLQCYDTSQSMYNHQNREIKELQRVNALVEKELVNLPHTPTPYVYGKVNHLEFANIEHYLSEYKIPITCNYSCEDGKISKHIQVNLVIPNYFKEY